MEGQTVYQWIVIGILVMAYAIEKAKKLFSNNPKGHGERIAKLETEIDNIKEDINEIKKKLNKK